MNLVTESDEDNALSAILFERLKTKDFENALHILKCKENALYVKRNSLDIVPVLSSFLEESFCTIDTEECIEEMFIYIASVANQKEAMLVFLEQVEMLKSKKQFIVLLKPLQTILMKHVSVEAKSSSFTWVFNTVTAHIAELSLPSQAILEGEERKLLDADPNLQHLADVLGATLLFYQNFYEKVLAKELIWPGKECSTGELLSFYILKLFHKPFTYLDIYTSENSGESILYTICSKYVFMASKLLINPFKLLSYVKPKDCSTEEGKSENREEDEKVDSVSQLSIAMYFYCVLGQRMSETILPCVYTNDYLYFSCLPCCVYLMEEKGVYPVHKGLILFRSLLTKLDDTSILKGCLDVPNHLQILRDFVQIMTLSESRECRILALECMKQWLRKLVSSERYRLFLTILSTVSHPGILGVIIHELKENIRHALLNVDILDNNFCGSKLQKLLILSCGLPHDEKTDILEWSDKIMGALNLLIFICLSDPQNRANYKCILPKLSKEFLVHIENGLRMSKGHYELRLRELKAGKSQSSMDVSVNGDSIPNIPIEQELAMMVQALNWFDTIQSVWARASKLVNESISS